MQIRELMVNYTCNTKKWHGLLRERPCGTYPTPTPWHSTCNYITAGEGIDCTHWLFLFHSFLRRLWRLEGYNRDIWGPEVGTLPGGFRHPPPPTRSQGQVRAHTEYFRQDTSIYSYRSKQHSTDMGSGLRGVAGNKKGALGSQEGCQPPPPRGSRISGKVQEKLMCTFLGWRVRGGGKCSVLQWENFWGE